MIKNGLIMFRYWSQVNSGIWALSSSASAFFCYQYWVYHQPVFEIISKSRYVTVKNLNSLNSLPIKVEQMTFFPKDFEVVSENGKFIGSHNGFKQYFKRTQDRETNPETCRLCYSEPLFGRLVCKTIKTA